MSYLGNNQAFVRDINDPQRLGRIRCFCPGIMGNVDSRDYWLGWATPELPLATDPNAESGSLNVPPLGSLVNITFRDGNPDFPVYGGGNVTGRGDSTSSVPRLARGYDDGTLGTEETVEGVSVPKSSGGRSAYPHNRMVRTPAGHVVELDDTAGNRRIRIRHADGSFVELRSLGDLLFYAVSGIILYAVANIRIASKANVIIAAGNKVKLGGETGTFLPVARHDDNVEVGYLSGTVTVGAATIPVVLTLSSVPSLLPTEIHVTGTVQATSTKVESL